MTIELAPQVSVIIAIDVMVIGPVTVVD